MMKTIFTILFCFLAVMVQAASPTFSSFDANYFGTNSLLVTKLWQEYGTNLLIIDNSIGNDTAAAAFPYTKPWKTAFDLIGGGSTPGGAIVAATNGDMIVFLASATPYQCPSLPLSMKGLSLLVMDGVTINRTNFINGSAVDLIGYGPLIIPGTNSSVIVNGTVRATNSLGADAAFGWSSTASLAPNFGISNNIGPTNIILDGYGTLIGSSDGIYITGSLGGSGEIRNLKIVTGRDGVFINDQAANSSTGVPPMSWRTKRLDVITGTNSNSTQTSHGAIIQCLGFVDDGSVFDASGGTASSGNNAGLYALFNSAGSGFLTNGALLAGQIELHGTFLKTHGDPTNVSPLILVNASVTGSWSELTASNAWTIFNANDYIGFNTATNYSSSTNIIRAVNTPGTANTSGPYTYGTGTYTGGNANLWLSNNVPGNPNFWLVHIGAGAGTVVYFSVTGLFGVFSPTNTGAAPGPIYGSSNFLSVVVTKIPLGQITNITWITGALNTNLTGRSIQVRSGAFYVPVSTAGLAAEDLLVDPLNTGTFVRYSRVGEGTIIGSIANTNYGTLNAYVPTNGVFTFTNKSTGGANVAGLDPGSGQQIIQ